MPILEDNQKWKQVAQKVASQSKLLRAWELNGGISAQVTGLEIQRPDGHTQKMIVRQPDEKGLKRHAQRVADEFKLLSLLHSYGVVAPEPYYLDQSGEIFSAPYLIMEYVEGEPEFAPADLPAYLLQLATHLSWIHQIDASQMDLSFLPGIEQRYADKLKERPAQVDESLNEGRIRDVLEAVWPIPGANSSVLLHGDFWPGNTLWRHGQLMAIIDWEDAASGDPLADVANSRLELLWAFGIDAMQLFTQQYRSRTTVDFTHLPYWDLCAALRPISQASQWAEWVAGEQAMREGHRWFVTQALEKLSIFQ
jgi:aminoglycoside phosphotransferase (APT) family kinase protein